MYYKKTLIALTIILGLMITLSANAHEVKVVEGKQTMEVLKFNFGGAYDGMSITFKNNSDQTVKAFGGNIVCTDLLGGTADAGIKALGERIEPGGSYTGKWHTFIYMGNEHPEDFVCVLENQKVVY